ncbi:MAG: hypothetical protein HY000_28890 [Planctomycetes bacterium]|nr:hypothetical protein [Planctomycetota bacterium]
MIGMILNNRYQIVAKLGEGGMGVVYLAGDLLLERQVAVKLLNPEYSGPVALERLRREALMQARLEHPNIVRATMSGAIG